MTATRVRFADPSTCPDCRSRLPVGPEQCPACRLPLRGPVAQRLLTTLGTADALLDELRASAVAAPEPAPAPAPFLEPYPVTREVPAVRSGLRTTSVPKILLGLGATCLLVAAVIFLAVAWSWLGVGGRTLVLVALTAGSLGLGGLLARRELRIAGEALTTLGLGLLALDVTGAHQAGWLGELEASELVTAVGFVVASAAFLLALPVSRLVVPQLAAPFGLVVAFLGAAMQTEHHQVLAFAAVVSFVLMSLAGRSLGAPVLTWTAAIAAMYAWAALLLLGLSDAGAHPTARGLWLDGHGWGLAAAAALALLPWPLLGLTLAPVRQASVTVTALILTCLVVLPGLDDGLTRATVVMSVATLGWAVAALVAPAPWRSVPRAPLAGSVALPAVVAVVLLGEAVETVLVVGEPFTRDPGVRLDPAGTAVPPYVLLVATAALLVAGAAVMPRRVEVAVVAGVVAATSGTAFVVLLGVPLWSLVGLLLVAAAGLTVDSLRHEGHRAGLAAGGGAVLGLGAVVLALPSAHLATASLAVWSAGAIAVLLRGRFAHAPEWAGGLLPLALGGLLWSGLEVAGTDAAQRAVPVLVVVGLLALVRPRPEVELTAAAAALVAALAAVPLAEDVSVSLAVHLTLAGALVTTSALVNPARRPLGWLGGLLLAGATWVRLADVGVEAPEPYTLPSAGALILVGLHRMRVAPSTPTMVALGPGLVLATVPSFLWVLADPVTMRAAWLGGACLALVLVGARLRWSAPVLVGAVVGGLVVLRELAPYAAETPQWVLIGLAGTLLVGTGITWEARVRDLQRAAAYLGRLR